MKKSVKILLGIALFVIVFAVGNTVQATNAIIMSGNASSGTLVSAGNNTANTNANANTNTNTNTNTNVNTPTNLTSTNNTARTIPQAGQEDILLVAGSIAVLSLIAIVTYRKMKNYNIK